MVLAGAAPGRAAEDSGANPSATGAAASAAEPAPVGPALPPGGSGEGVRLTAGLVEGRLEVRLAGTVAAARTMVRVRLARTLASGVEVEAEGRPVHTAFVPVEGGGGTPWLEMLVGPGPRARYTARFLPAPLDLSTGRGVVLEPGPDRPFEVSAPAGIEVVGVEGRSGPDSGFTGHLGGGSRLGLVWSAPDRPEERLVAKAEVERILAPPRPFRVDVRYRVLLEAVAADFLVTDLDPAPPSELRLPITPKMRVLAVRVHETGGVLPFRQEEGELRILIGPGAGPRRLEVVAQAAGPGRYGEEIDLPWIPGPPGRPREQGWVALDDRNPGDDGALSGIEPFGESGPGPANAIPQELRRAWGPGGYRTSRTGRDRPRIVISKREAREVDLRVDAQAETLLHDGGQASTAVTFSLPRGARWVDLVAELPKGAETVSLFEDGTLRPLILDRSQGRTVRFRVGDGVGVKLAYQFALEPQDTVPRLSLPTLTEPVGLLAWAVRAGPGMVLGDPRVVRVSAPGSAETSGTSQGATGPGAGAVDPAAASEADQVGVMPPHSTGRVARASWQDLPAGRTAVLEVPLAREEDVSQGMLLVFVAGLLVALWAVRGARTDGDLAWLGASVPVLLVGIRTARAWEVATPWWGSFVSGVVFGALAVLVWWGVRAPEGAGVVDKPARGTRPRDGKDGARDRSEGAPKGS